MASVKVATLNLFNRMGEWGHRAPLVIDQLEELLPDVIGLQEVDMVLDQGMWISKQVNLRLPNQPHYRIKHAPNPGQRASYHGIATLSRIGFDEHEILDLMTFERNAQRMGFHCGATPFWLINTHLHFPPEATQERVEELQYLLAWLDRDPRRLPTVIVGDFNAYADPPEEAVTLMKSRFRSAYETVHGRRGRTTRETAGAVEERNAPHRGVEHAEARVGERGEVVCEAEFGGARTPPARRATSWTTGRGYSTSSTN